MVKIAIAMTAGTNIPLTLSAIFAAGAFVAAASLTKSIIFAIAVSEPIRAALHFRKPLMLIVAACTQSPTLLSTGRLSPVKADSSMAADPSMMRPSAAKLSPARTIKISPAISSKAGMTVSAPSRSTETVFGESAKSDCNAVVFPVARASSSFPTVMSVTIIAADSKYNPRSRSAIPPALGSSAVIANNSAMLHAKDAPEPRATSVSMFGARFIMLLNPLIKNF